MSSKPLKITGDLKYLPALVPSMMKRIDRGDGMNFGRAKNYHNVSFEMNTGEKITAYAYETKSLIIMSWGVDND